MTLFFLFFLSGSLQAKTINKHWCFGDSIYVEFTNDMSFVRKNTMKSIESSSTAIYSSGKLALYSNGLQVYNPKGDLIENGDSLLGHHSSTQGVLICPLPASDSIFYIFTVINLSKKEGAHYSVVDMKANNGEGKVIKKNIKLLDSALVAEKIAATYSSNNSVIWLAFHRVETSDIAIMKLDKNGVILHTVFPSTLLYKNNNTAVGAIKFSNDGSKLALCNWSGTQIELFDFDKRNGVLSKNYKFNSKNWIYGLEFSPNSKFLYSTQFFYDTVMIFQHNLYNYESKNIYKGLSKDGTLLGMQLGPDGKIYLAANGNSYLSAINLVDDEEPMFIKEALLVKDLKVSQGLPNLISNQAYNFSNCVDYLSHKNLRTQRIELQSDAFYSDSSLILNVSEENKVGAVWTSKKLELNDNFEIVFQLRISNGNNFNLPELTDKGADGFAFVFQNNETNQIGRRAAGMGYAGINNAIAIEFDMFSNFSEYDSINDPTFNHISVQYAKDAAISERHNPQYQIASAKIPHAVPTADSDYFVKIKYEGKHLEIYFSMTEDFEEPNLVIADFEFSDYMSLEQGSGTNLGITASTGGASEQHEVVYWDICGLREFSGVNSIEVFSNDKVNAEKLYNSIRVYNVIGQLIYENNLPAMSLENLKQELKSLNDKNLFLILTDQKGMISTQYLLNFQD